MEQDLPDSYDKLTPESKRFGTNAPQPGQNGPKPLWKGSGKPLYGYILLLTAASGSVPGNLALIALLLLLSGLISGSEVAFFSLNHKDYEDFDKDDSPAAQRILKLARSPRMLLATILIANNFINIAIVLVSDRLVNLLLPPKTFAAWGEALQSKLSFMTLSVEQLAHIINFSITVVAVTSLLVLFGEVAPKIYAAMNRRQFALRMASPLMLMMKLFSPLSKLLVNGTGLIEKRLVKLQSKNTSRTKREDIDHAIDLTLKEAENTEEDNKEDIKQEMDILKRITTFKEVPVRRIMRSRVDIIALDIELSYDKVLQTIRESGFSRLPVYEEDLDNVKGILYAKDLIEHLDKNPDFRWQKLVRSPALFEPETKKIHDMLQVFKEKHQHMAIIVDEYGGTVGLVTLEDILEEIVGEIRDEFDKEEENDFKKIDDCTFEFDGKIQLHDFFRKSGIEEETFDDKAEEVDTLAGLILEIAGDFPEENQTLRYKDYAFTIMEMDKRRIEKVQVKWLGHAKDENGETCAPEEKT